MLREDPQARIPFKILTKFFEESVSAFILLEQKKIVHRDLKPDNILLKINE